MPHVFLWELSLASDVTRLLSPASSAEAGAGWGIPWEELPLRGGEMLRVHPFVSLLAGYLCPALLNMAVPAPPDYLLLQEVSIPFCGVLGCSG